MGYREIAFTDYEPSGLFQGKKRHDGSMKGALNGKVQIRG
jgi:hypothetical protein